MHIVVICGGTSAERQVSLRSGDAVAKALASAGHTVRVLDTDATDEQLKNCDTVFPVLHGEGGEDGVFQERLEQLGVTFVGSGSAASRLCMDKAAYRSKMIAAGLTMPKGQLVNLSEYWGHELTRQPHILKPNNGGSSIGVYIVRDPSQIDKNRVEQCFSENEMMLIEELIEGTELTVGILGNFTLPIIEIIPPDGKEFDYENKYNGATQELCPAVHINEEDTTRVQKMGLEAHALAGCRDFSRSDMILRANGELFLLETNTIPGMTEQSLYPKMGLAYQMSMPVLCNKLVELANGAKLAFQD